MAAAYRGAANADPCSAAGVGQAGATVQGRKNGGAESTRRGGSA